MRAPRWRTQSQRQKSLFGTDPPGCLPYLVLSKKRVRRCEVCRLPDELMILYVRLYRRNKYQILLCSTKGHLNNTNPVTISILVENMQRE